MSSRRRSVLIVLGTIAPIVLVVALAFAQGDPPRPKPLPPVRTVAEGSNSAGEQAQAAAEREAAADEVGWKRAARAPGEATRTDVCTGKPMKPGPTTMVTNKATQCPHAGGRHVRGRRGGGHRSPHLTRSHDPGGSRRALSSSQVAAAENAGTDIARYCLTVAKSQMPSNAQTGAMVDGVYRLMDYARKDPDTYYGRSTMRQRVGEARDTLATGYPYPCSASEAQKLSTLLETLPR